MAKLKLLSQHKIENTPDHILEEITRSCTDLVIKMLPIIESMPPNIALNAIQWANAALIKHLVTNNPEELRKAAEWAAVELINNVEKLILQDSQKEC